MDLSTTYLGLKLPHPFMPGASPIVDDLDTVRRLEDAGASAIVMHSLFEEQISREEWATHLAVDRPKEQFAEALSYLPEPDEFALGPDDYIKHLGRVKQAVRVPVIASLNGTTKGGWLRFAPLMEQAGADALELNLYHLSSNFDESSQDVERRSLEIVKAVKESVKIPVAVKLSPFYTSLPHFAAQLQKAGAAGLVLFNRFYQPDIDVEELDVLRNLNLSDSSDLLLRLRWLAILSGRFSGSLAVTGGVHTPIDAVKSIMAGADAVQLVSAVLRHGPTYIGTLRDKVSAWLTEHEYESLAQMRGNMSLQRCPDPSIYERANYMKILQSWKV